MTASWSNAATEHLASIRDYHSRSDPAYASALASRILARADAAAAHPMFGAEVPKYTDPTIREVYEHPYRVIYRIVGSGIEILAVHHSARRLPRTLG